MRILVLTPTFLPALGGAEMVLLNVFRRMARRHTVLILTPHLAPALLRHSSSAAYDPLMNFEVERYQDRLSFMKIRGHRLSLGLIPPFSVSAVAALRKTAGTFKPDLINVHYVMPTGLAALFARRIRKIPVVVTYNGRDVPGPLTPPLWKYWHRWVGKSCTDMTFVSRYCRDAIYGAGSSLGRVIYNGVEEPALVPEERIRALRSRLHLSSDEQVILALQRLDSLKRTDVILQSMPRVLAARPRTRLIIAGQGPDLRRLKEVSTALGIDRSVTFAGFLPDEEKPSYFALADLFVFHSTYETFGIVLAEAMSYGKPVVSVRNTAIPEIVEHGKAGLLVPTLDHDAFAEAVLQLLRNPSLRAQMGKHGFERARSAFRWESIVPAYEAVFQAAVSGGRR